MNVVLCRAEDVCARTLSSPRYKSMKIINENFVAIFLQQTAVHLNKAFPIGFTILERSKQFMYDQFYNVIRPALHQCDVQIIFSDTDSFGLEITSPLGLKLDPYKNLEHCFDFSNYPKTHPKFSSSRTNALGFWKDELQGMRMREFVGLRSKTYAFLLEDVLKSKCKGVTKAYKKTLSFDKFKQCISTISQTTINQYHIRSINQVIKTLKVTKRCFSSFDDKRYLLCAIHSTPYGSKLIKLAKKLNACPFCVKEIV